METVVSKPRQSASVSRASVAKAEVTRTGPQTAPNRRRAAAVRSATLLFWPVRAASREPRRFSVSPASAAKAAAVQAARVPAELYEMDCPQHVSPGDMLRIRIAREGS